MICLSKITIFRIVMSNYQRACTCNMYVPYQGSKRFQSAEHDANYGWMLMYGVGSR